MNNQILDFVLVNLVKPLGSRCIPFDIYQRFVNVHVTSSVVICTITERLIEVVYNVFKEKFCFLRL